MSFKTLNFLPILIAAIFILSSCSETDPVINDIHRQGKLIVLTVNAPTTYYIGADSKPTGFEVDLSKALADSLNVPIEYKIFDTMDELLTAINNNEGHIVAAGLTQTLAREKEHVFAPSYKTIQQYVVCHRKTKLPSNVNDLLNRSLLVLEGSSYQETLINLQKEHPSLKWQSIAALSSDQLLSKIHNKEVDCTVIDSNIFNLNRRYFPNLVKAFAISEEQHLAWVLPANVGQFKQYLVEWFAQEKEKVYLNMIDERYYGYADIFDFYDNHIFLKRIKTRLPQYTADFKKVAEQYSLPWTLLAAQAYQESSWHAGAKSPTGVRGLMMLTQSTAKSMGVKNRIDPLQSIQGGAKYLDYMLSRVSEDVLAENKIWFALAAYNVGYAHMLDARKLAIELGKNPNTWHDIREVFPLLSQKKYYKKLKYGYARGSEPIKYIDRIRYYQDVLLHELEKPQS